MNNFTKVFRNTLFLFGSEIILKILGFFWTIFLARSLGVELFGRYSFVTAFISLFAFLPDLGIGIIVIRDIAKNKKNAAVLLGNSFAINVFFAFVTFILILVLAFFFRFSQEVLILTAVASITLFFSTIRSVGIFYFDGMEKMQYSAALNTLNTILLYLFALLLLALKTGIIGIFTGILLGTIVSLGSTWWITFKKGIIPKINFNLLIARHLIFDGLPLAIAAFASIIYSRIDTIILTRFLGERSAGIYNVATPFSFALIGLLNVPFMVALFPTLSRLSSESPKRFKRAFYKSMIFIALWSFPAVIGISIFAFLIPFIFGAKYAMAIGVLRVHIFMVPFSAFNALLYKILIVLGKQKTYLYISLIGAVLNVIFNIILIPRFYIVGAASAAVLTQLILFIIYFFVVNISFKKLS